MIVTPKLLFSSPSLDEPPDALPMDTTMVTGASESAVSGSGGAGTDPEALRFDIELRDGGSVVAKLRRES
jgi:hypothetical protein